MHTINGRPIPQDAGFTDANGTQYPPNWLTFATDEEKASIGIEWIADPEPYDDRFYWSAGHAKDIDQVKAVLVGQIRQTAYGLLQPTDYVDLRNLRDPTYKPDVMTWRDAVRAASNTNEALVAAATTVEELASLNLTWPLAD